MESDKDISDNKDQHAKPRVAPISYRVPSGLEQEFAQMLEASGLSRNAFITKALFGRKAPRAARRPVVEKQLLAHLLSQTARLHDELHEISLMAGPDAGVALKLEQAVAELAAIRQACFHAMGRRS